jgi:hypothetical protein
VIQRDRRGDDFFAFQAVAGELDGQRRELRPVSPIQLGNARLNGRIPQRVQPELEFEQAPHFVGVVEATDRPAPLALLLHCIV